MIHIYSWTPSHDIVLNPSFGQNNAVWITIIIMKASGKTKEPLSFVKQPDPTIMQLRASIDLKHLFPLIIRCHLIASDLACAMCMVIWYHDQIHIGSVQVNGTRNHQHLFPEQKHCFIGICSILPFCIKVMPIVCEEEHWSATTWSTLVFLGGFSLCWESIKDGRNFKLFTPDIAYLFHVNGSSSSGGVEYWSPRSWKTAVLGTMHLHLCHVSLVWRTQKALKWDLMS